ncbi:MAG: putative toxin-antitoxin system toxin component, PIN family [Deltaproteobacteria bacterium]|nr:putative toxin-antitoxin system toxin component, PIN family [Deltaproteobacteria bacterium]
MIRAVLDTNVVVSGILSPQGVPAQILRAGIDKAFTFLFSPPIFIEIRRVFHYPKIAKLLSARQIAHAELEDLLASLAAFAVITPGKLVVEVVSADPDDNMFLACALEGRADYLVSGDTHLLTLKTYRHISIVTPQEFWALLEKQKAHRLKNR